MKLCGHRRQKLTLFYLLQAFMFHRGTKWTHAKIGGVVKNEINFK